jgi:hemerythrin-like domain-containing protein
MPIIMGKVDAVAAAAGGVMARVDPPQADRVRNVATPAGGHSPDHQHESPQEALREALSPELLHEPLDYILADHVRQRAVCTLLRSFVVAKRAKAEDAELVRSYLTHDIDLHHDDEEKDLFPMLRRRALPDDELDKVLDRLSDDHRRSEALIIDILRHLSQPAVKGEIPLRAPAREALEVYAAAEHRHLAIENAVVMTIAAVRLNRSDLKALARNMAARRGLADPGGESNVAHT